MGTNNTWPPRRSKKLLYKIEDLPDEIKEDVYDIE